MFPLRSGTPNLAWQISASLAIPSRITGMGGWPKQIRIRWRFWLLLTLHSVPGLISIPSSSAA